MNKKLKPHPLGSLLPPMSDHEYNTLKLGMKETGFDRRHPVVLLEGMILDGCHRYTAAIATKQDAEFIDFEKLGFAGKPIEYVMQENLRRRNLTPSQSATIGAELVDMMAADEMREREAAKAAGKKPAPKTNKAKAAAEALSVAESSVKKASALKKEDPETFEQVKAGSLNLDPAVKEAARKKAGKPDLTDQVSAATDALNTAFGENWTELHTKHLKPKDILALWGLDSTELHRIKPLIECGWTLKLATGYQSTQLSAAHPMRQFIDRACASGGIFRWIGEAYGKTFDVEVKERA